MSYRTNLIYCFILPCIACNCPELIGITCIRNLTPRLSSNPNIFSWAQLLEYVRVMAPNCPFEEAITRGPISGRLPGFSSLNPRPLYWLPTAVVTSYQRICNSQHWFVLLESECHKSKSQVSGELYVCLWELGETTLLPVQSLGLLYSLSHSHTWPPLFLLRSCFPLTSQLH